MKQPAGFFPLIGTQVWESFSFYGMRALLVLYLIHHAKYNQTDAFAIYALYTSFVELAAFLGGYVGDKWLGLKQATLIGGSLICFGHITLALPQSNLFFFGLGLIACGTTLFRSNLKGLFGKIYQENTSRESGFTLFYTSINIAGFAAAVSCAFVAEYYGWHKAFGLAAVGMILGMSIFLYFGKLFESAKKPSTGKSSLFIGGFLGVSAFLAFMIEHYQTSQKILIPVILGLFVMAFVFLKQSMEKSVLQAICKVAGLLTLYFTASELMGSSLVVLLENHFDRMVFGIEIPTAAISSINPLMILLSGPLLVKALQKLPLSRNSKLSFAFLLLGIGFGSLFLATTFHSLSLIVLGIGFVALGELFIAPTVFAFCSEIASEKNRGLLMGIVTMAFALASLLSGQVAQVMTKTEGSLSTLFIGITGLSMAGWAILHFMNKKSSSSAQIAS